MITAKDIAARERLERGVRDATPGWRLPGVFGRPVFVFTATCGPSPRTGTASSIV